MDVFMNLIGTVGFPIAACVFLAMFMAKYFTKSEKEQIDTLKALQADSKAREDKLYNELAEARKVNSEAIQTIAKYAEKLDCIQNDITSMKTDITVIKTNQEKK